MNKTFITTNQIFDPSVCYFTFANKAINSRLTKAINEDKSLFENLIALVTLLKLGYMYQLQSQKRHHKMNFELLGIRFTFLCARSCVHYLKG